ncbi:Cytochrome P450 2W1 [Plecturocebus cupreus]
MGCPEVSLLSLALWGADQGGAGCTWIGFGRGLHTLSSTGAPAQSLRKEGLPSELGPGPQHPLNPSSEGWPGLRGPDWWVHQNQRHNSQRAVSFTPDRGHGCRTPEGPQSCPPLPGPSRASAPHSMKACSLKPPAGGCPENCSLHILEVVGRVGEVRARPPGEAYEGWRGGWGAGTPSRGGLRGVAGRVGCGHALPGRPIRARGRRGPGGEQGLTSQVLMAPLILLLLGLLGLWGLLQAWARDPSPAPRWPPGPRPLPLIGNLHLLRLSQQDRSLMEVGQRTRQLSPPGRTCVLTPPLGQQSPVSTVHAHTVPAQRGMQEA